MLAGHFATALIAHQKVPKKGALLFFLIASQLQDLLWLSFHYLGLEPTIPADVLDVTLMSITVDMVYSHDLLPQLVWIALTFIIGRLLFKQNDIAIAGALLVLGHYLLDLLSGYPHHIFGGGTHEVGLGLYYSNVYLAIFIEAVFTAIALAYYFRVDSKRSKPRSQKNRLQIAGLFVFGIVFILSIASVSFRQWFSIPEFEAPFNTTMLSLVFTYLPMIAYLLYCVRRETDTNLKGLNGLFAK
ncbi:MAG: hypothetical protein COW03_11175 [Cytophagales bacterium CG12_big_fil_rev_8_21_14_0_65_40_12]|nr:MAG: hypothetical protein COW03_11175 [Cytophagales bacterium CG12_big_fil_rev_8_21_14_0_65_40_12]PIW03511.1 MAG: hypothetical protein COW40_14390 [Cytophagales bacterium CG17_big_fil_post_rev_8_21_14_2_50_40_13]